MEREYLTSSFRSNESLHSSTEDVLI